jgi:pyridoxal phosphate enzyme (YggS family)
MTAPVHDIQANLERVREQIRTAAVAVGRRPEAIRLVAVSKYMPESYLREAMQAGQHVFGENTVQDALGKLHVLQDPGNEWHFIGHLQTNKAKHIPGNFSWLHTLDSIKLANRLARHCQETHTTLNILIQVNISGDPDKHGLPAARLFGFTEQLLEAGHAGLSLRGLMTIGRRDASVAERQREFATLRELAAASGERFGASRFGELSMGMSSDFEQAIREGASIVRVGSAIFGPRPLPADRTSCKT